MKPWGRQEYVLIPARDAGRLLVAPLDEIPKSAVEVFTRHLPGKEPEEWLRVREDFVVAGKALAASP